MVQNIVALVCGAVFAVGLAIGGMTDPQRVKGFLDVFGTWDPTLVFVLAGAVGTAFVLNLVGARRGSPLFEASFSFPASKTVDRKLLAGAALFGVGWGMSGFCPGPALAATVGGFPSVFILLAAMIATMLAYDRLPLFRKTTARLAANPDG